MNHQVALLLKKFCEIKKQDYNAGKRIYNEMTKEEKAQMVTAMRTTIEVEKSSRIEKPLKV